MGNWGGDSGTQHLLLAETLGLAMARRAADILERHRRRLARTTPGDGALGVPGDGARAAAQFPADDPESAADDARFAAADTRLPADDARFAADDAQTAADDAIFTAVLDATNDCLGRFDPRPTEDRWCDALLQLLLLARQGSHID